MKIVSFTTEEASGEGSNNGHAKHLIDGNVETFWHSRWQGGSDPLPYEIIIDMNHRVKIAQIELLPRGRGSNNPIKVVRFEASEDGTNWESIGQFGFTNRCRTKILCKIIHGTLYQIGHSGWGG